MCIDVTFYNLHQSLPHEQRSDIKMREHETCVSYLLVVYVEIRYKPTDLLTLKKKSKCIGIYLIFKR